ncbi:MAG TPA: hypothetical protein DEP48_07125 [Persephonella sp.]|uniref:Biopolymer transporter ExbD n=1 Tax=Persephonella marina (strain DSM 14350 / EX-H1) TaxID=123214 RepID=C0QUA2_PERMH|nr:MULTISPECIES: biopolymer transporter ExbD [Persephonella]ACO03443.1 hypothetical protein PERMA_0477 [Persephonella marina EX-H1]HCB70115.1 hypothetical protein [Persephonella sp.]
MKFRQGGGKVSVAFIDVFFNLMFLFLILAIIHNSSNEATELDAKDREKNTGNMQILDDSYYIGLKNNKWVVSKDNREVLISDFEEIIKWIKQNKPTSVVILADSKKRIRMNQVFKIIEAIQNSGGNIYYAFQ